MILRCRATACLHTGESISAIIFGIDQHARKKIEPNGIDGARHLHTIPVIWRRSEMANKRERAAGEAFTINRERQE